MENRNDILKTPEIPFELLGRMSASINLFIELSDLMKDEMIRYIAEADYGDEKEKCYNILKEIITKKEFPQTPDFILIECLNLTKWIKPKNKDEHIIRAFSSTLLLILEIESNYSIEVENEALATLLDSVFYLDSCIKSTQEFIVWRIISDYNNERAFYLEDEELKYYVDEITIDEFFIYALLLIMIFNSEEENDIGMIAGWIINMGKFNRNEPPYDSNSRENQIIDTNIFLLGLTNFNQCHYLWKEMSIKLLEKKGFIKSKDINATLEYIVNSIISEKI